MRWTRQKPFTRRHHEASSEEVNCRVMGMQQLPRQSPPQIRVAFWIGGVPSPRPPAL